MPKAGHMVYWHSGFTSVRLFAGYEHEADELHFETLRHKRHNQGTLQVQQRRHTIPLEAHITIGCVLHVAGEMSHHNYRYIWSGSQTVTNLEL